MFCTCPGWRAPRPGYRAGRGPPACPHRWPAGPSLSTINVHESLRPGFFSSRAQQSDGVFGRLKEYLVLTFIVTSTGVCGLSPTIRTPGHVADRPRRQTHRRGLHARPPALSRYASPACILLVNHPPVPLMTKIRTARVTLRIRTVSPTRSATIFSCFWLARCSVDNRSINKQTACSLTGLIWKLRFGAGPPPKTKAPTPPWLAKGGAFGADLGLRPGTISDSPNGCASPRTSPVSALFSETASPACLASSSRGPPLPAIARFIILVVTRLVIRAGLLCASRFSGTRRLTSFERSAVARPFTSGRLVLARSPRLPSHALPAETSSARDTPLRRLSPGHAMSGELARPPVAAIAGRHDSPTHNSCLFWLARVHVPSATLAEPYAARANTALPRPSAALRSRRDGEARVHIVTTTVRL